ncbi:hypothetical protein PsYK624_124130 [Phanerochaete sordida]|uniref:EF-hand domain-containing protein n=1 Tax=Phanerochaete sordida TaxID=48140 RepID=A0A9P3LJ10_9APHY|nr:hypothetical protein PsYK624_124130 [Phanerochaete sordida]
MASRPKPKKQYSFYSLRARFAGQSQSQLAVPPMPDEVFPLSAPANVREWDPSQLLNGGYPSPSPSASSVSHPNDKFLPTLPSPEQSSPPRVRPPPRESSKRPEIVIPERHKDGHQASFPQPGHDQPLITVDKRGSAGPSVNPDVLNMIPHKDVTIFAPVSISFAQSHDAHGAVRKLKEGMNEHPVRIPSLLHALDEIAKVHVTISVAVLAFKAAYNMIRTKRDNDKRIMVIFEAMHDMFVALLQLQNIKDPHIAYPGGELLEGRLQTVCNRAAGNIRQCMNLCDKYQKTNAVVKVLRSQNWEVQLTNYISVFAQRRQDFEFALMIHNTQTLDEMESTMREMNQRLSQITALLVDVYRNEWRPSKETDVAGKIADMGGAKAVEKSDAALGELVALDATDTRDNGPEAVLQTKGSAFSLQELKDELLEDWDATVAKNMKTFEGKFNLYQRQLQEELLRVTREGTDRIIDELNRGPHDRIKNEELRAMWKDMDWKLNVKARTFVMTLRDHYRDKAENSSFGMGSADKWAFEYISAKYLQPIMEAFDDDGSGYVTYQEVNEFVDGTPEELAWTLPHWVAYWAVGWQSISWTYGQKIIGLLNDMFSLRGELLPENRYWADYYLRNVWPVAFELVKGFHPANLPEHVEAKFQAFAELEEERIRQNLDAIRFDIDALDTVYVVAGPGRIEKYMFPLVYLLLKRDIQVFCIAKKLILHKEELLDSADSLLWVFRAVTYRYLDLKTLFKQNQLNVDSQMKIAACGLFEFLHSPSSLWTWNNLKDAISPVAKSNLPDFRQQTLSYGEVLNYEPQNDHKYKCAIYEAATEQATETDAHAPMPVRAILLEWNGFVYDGQHYPTQLMLSFHAHAVSTSDPQRFRATGMHNGVPFKLAGRCFQDQDNKLHVRFSVAYAREYHTQHFCGRLDDNLDIVGSAGGEADPATHEARFFLKAVPAARYLRFRPSPAERAAGGARALWKYALDAAVHRIRRQRLAWSFIDERRELGMRYIEMSISFEVYGHSPSTEELAEWTRCKREVTAIDASFFRVLRDARLKTIPAHECHCRGCGGKIGGARVVCLDCLSAETGATTVDFCDRPECWRKTILPDPCHPDRQHLHTHDVLKVRTVLHLVDMASLRERAQNALSISNEYLHCPEREPALDAVDDAIALYYDTTSEPRHSTISVNGPHCRICRALLHDACWSCVDCFDFGQDTLICDACEQRTMLRCIRCEKPFKQPTWYYGSLLADNFMCNVCTARRGSPPSVEKEKLHRYTHALVRCTRKAANDPRSDTQTTEERVSSLEDAVWCLSGKIERMEQTLARIEHLLLAGMPGASQAPAVVHAL